MLLLLLLLVLCKFLYICVLYIIYKSFLNYNQTEQHNIMNWPI